MSLILKVLLFLGLFTGANGLAAEFSYVIGGLTPHIVKPEGIYAKPLCNEISQGSGVIYNRVDTYRYSYKDSKWSSGAIVGENSYCEPIWGAAQSYRFFDTPRFEMQGTFGFYHFDEEGFDFSQGAYFSKLGDFYFVPIVGVEMNLTLYDGKDLKVKLMNLITPVITHHSLGFIFAI